MIGVVVALTLSTVSCSSDAADGLTSTGGSVDRVCRPDGCLEWFTSFDEASIALDAVLEDLGHQHFGGDDPGAESASFLVGRNGTEEVQIITGWNLDGPQGTFDTAPGATGHFVPIRRGDRSGVWTTCGRLYVEVLGISDSPSIAESLAEEIDRRLCPT